MRFYLGTHHPSWLSWMDVPLCVSFRWLGGRTPSGLPRAVAPWMLDSGGFTQVGKYGREAWGWEDREERRRIARRYVRWVRTLSWEVGNLQWAAPQDWMCEEDALAKTGLTVAEHQRRTVVNFLELLELDGGGPGFLIKPTLQGGEDADDYRRCRDLYDRHGIDLTQWDTVGLGSVCRRAATRPIVRLVRELAGDGIRLHGFGVKSDALAHVGDVLASADSMAWSEGGKYEPGCAPGHKTEANCPRYALAWHGRVLDKIRPAGPAPATRPARAARPRTARRPAGQLSLFG